MRVDSKLVLDARKGLVAIAREVKSTPQAVFLLLLDLAEQGKISKRINYIWGCE